MRRYSYVYVMVLCTIIVHSLIGQSADSTRHALTNEPRFSLGFLFTPYRSITIIEPQLGYYYFYPRSIPNPGWTFQYNVAPQSQSYIAATGNFEWRFWKQLYLQGAFSIFQRKFLVKRELLALTNSNLSTSKKELSSTITILLPEIGLKYFLIPQRIHSASPYIFGSVGFQLPFVQFDYTTTNPDTSTRYNFETFLKEVNQATTVTFGAGGEYRFNPSLAVLMEFRWRLAYQKATYKKQTNNQNSSSSITNQWKLQTIETLWSIGLRMYF